MAYCVCLCEQIISGHSLFYMMGNSDVTILSFLIKPSRFKCVLYLLVIEPYFHKGRAELCDDIMVYFNGMTTNRMQTIFQYLGYSWKSCSLYNYPFFLKKIISSIVHVPLLQSGYCSTVRAILIENRLEVTRSFKSFLQLTLTQRLIVTTSKLVCNLHSSTMVMYSRTWILRKLQPSWSFSVNKWWERKCLGIEGHETWLLNFQYTLYVQVIMGTFSRLVIFKF